MNTVAVHARPVWLTRSASQSLAFTVAFAAYAALAVAATFPLVLHLSSTVPHDAGDPMLSAAILWWNAHVVPFTDRWWNGFTFYPASGMLAFSDTRLGESLIATPLQWFGATPIVAYNLTLIATYPLCAIAAHGLAWVITRRHDASAIAAVAYGFCPYRAAHIQHLELLGAFGLPLALAALHRYRDTDRPVWLAAFSAALVLQGLCTSYYLVFFTVLLALWIWWFIRLDVRRLLAIALASAAAAVALSPLLAGYVRIHSMYGFSRPFTEIVDLSADLSSFALASPLLALWGWTPRWIGNLPERELFPGLAIAALAVLGAVRAWRRAPRSSDRLARFAVYLLPVAAILASIAAFAWWLPPWRIAVPGLLVSSDAPYKPLSLAIVALVASFALTSRARGAYRRRSPLAFYLVATVVLYVCALGPKPAVLGHQVFYEPPYAWLMALPGFGSIRVPARFAMIAMLPLTVAGAIAFDRLRLHAELRVAAAALLMAAALADGWIGAFPLAPLPDAWPADRATEFSAVLELPFGDPFGDLAATYRAARHGKPLVNGNSGFEPTHYYTLRTALAEHDAAVLDGLPSSGRILVVDDRQADPRGEWTAAVMASRRASTLGGDERWTLLGLEPPPAPPPICDGERAAITSARDGRGRVALRAITDGDPHTWWATPVPQRVGETLDLDLASAARPCALLLSVGEFRISYPRALRVETSLDGSSWTTVALQRTAGLTMRAAIDDPRAVTLKIALAPSDARFVRLRLEDSHPTIPWIVTDVAVVSAATPSQASTSALPQRVGSSPARPCTYR